MDVKSKEHSSSHVQSRKMRNGIYSKRQHFDNLSYISDGRDRISYTNDPYAVSSRNTALDGNGFVLQPSELKKSRRENDIIYTFRPGQDSIYAYNNAAFSDISGVDSRGLSTRSQNSNLYTLQNSFEKSNHNRKVFRICLKYWYIFGFLILIVLAAIGVGIGFAVLSSKHKSTECYLLCDPSEKRIQLNSTYCECQFINECKFLPPICGQFPCIKFNGTGFECNCTTGFQHPPTTNDLTHCEDIDECKNSRICGEHQTCNNTFGSYICFCENGYETITSANEIICQDKNECTDNNICSNGYCINTNGSFECVCNAGFIRDIFNPLHCEDINECLSSHNCTGDNEICENTYGSFRCICIHGYRRNEYGNCININECIESNTTCDINSRCEDRNGSFACCMNMITNECIECGYDYSNPRSVVINHVRRTRMIDGQPVESGRFPWIAVLLIKQEYYNSEPRYVCSGSLVSSWNIITAAHCLDEQHFRKQWDLTSEPNSFKDIFDIRISVHNLSLNSTDFIQSASYSIANFTLHPGYQSLGSEDATVKNDVALIKLTKRIERSSNIDWICLPTSVNIQDQTTLKVLSYGNTDDNLIQQQLDIRVLNNQESKSECQRQLGDIAEDAFCAISTNNSSLLGMGDSGAGAMLFSNNNRWHLAGVMSKTGLQKAYSAMTNVSMHIEWLKSLVER
ncbi:unnamed protein product [Rotaria sordida]|uniref:Uncharacterized protein n=2 Tax=Rotaria sordida TaxID=392033 RepID=A0A814XEF6_9BILA|nr:unnamed protein product [Rotaria sordida]CAF1212975.1 unnamed protein product [Rotaria sordida]